MHTCLSTYVYKLIQAYTYITLPWPICLQNCRLGPRIYASRPAHIHVYSCCAIHIYTHVRKCMYVALYFLTCVHMCVYIHIPASMPVCLYLYLRIEPSYRHISTHLLGKPWSSGTVPGPDLLALIVGHGLDRQCSTR